MKIDYKKEVDSGFDRKRIIESNIIALLRAGIPVDIITQNPNFNFKHYEMLRNLKTGYFEKEKEILELYGGYGKELDEQIVPDNYSGVSHPVGGELYPMTPQEERENFKKRDDYLKEIAKLRKLELRKLEKEKNKILNSIAKYKTKFPVVDAIIEVRSTLEEMPNDGSIDINYYAQLFKDNGLDLKKLKEYDKIYEDYKRLLTSLDEVILRYDETLSEKRNTKEISDMINKKLELETEIIKRNTKLVNAFIRDKYNDLLVETDDLFEVCYFALWNAVKDFDYSLGNKFSTCAYRYMDSEVKHSFKELTGYHWEQYWGNRALKVLMQNTSELLGRQVTVDDLVEYGFLDIPEVRARRYSQNIVECSLSELCKDFDERDNYKDDINFDDVDDYYSDDISDNTSESIDEEVLKIMLKEDINKVLEGLNDREKKVIILRYGLEGHNPHTLGEIGKLLNCTGQTVRLIEAKALRKLRFSSRLNKIRDYADGVPDYLPRR